MARKLDDICDAQYDRDIFQCKMVGLPACYAQAMERYAACMKGRQIHPSTIENLMTIFLRTLYIGRDGSQPIEVSLSLPEKTENGDFSCEFSISWPDRPRRRPVFGVDALQAFVLALNMVGAEIYSSEYHKEGQLRWKSLGDGYGFPVPAIIRDLAQGIDLK